MRHKKHRNSLGLTSAHRKALMSNLAVALIKNNRIKTTLKRAKAASQFVDKLITLAKKGDIAAQRQLFAVVKSRDLVQYLVKELGPRFANRKGGYTRVIKYVNRAGDNAPTAFLEFTELPEVKEVTKKKKTKKKKEPKDEAAEKTSAAEKKSTEETSAKKPTKPSRPEKKKGFFSKMRGKKK